MKKILFILAAKDFRDVEYFVPSEILKNAGHEIFIASDLKAGGTAVGADGGEVKTAYDIAEIHPRNFDLLVFVGGPGALKHLDNEISYNLARETTKTGKLLAAICIAPVILAKSGVLKNKKATVWHKPLEKKSIKILEENGAVFSNRSVVSDNGIITANSPQSAEEFGVALKEMLK